MYVCRTVVYMRHRYNRMPWLWFPPIFYALGYGRRYDACLKLLTDFTRNVGQWRFLNI